MNLIIELIAALLSLIGGARDDGRCVDQVPVADPISVHTDIAWSYDDHLWRDYDGDVVAIAASEDSCNVAWSLP